MEKAAEVSMIIATFLVIIVIICGMLGITSAIIPIGGVAMILGLISMILTLIMVMRIKV